MYLCVLLVQGVAFGETTKSSSDWPPRGVEGLGMSIHLTADETPAVRESYEKQLDQIADMGLKIVRMSGEWRWTDKAKGEYDLQPYHWLVDACEKRGLRVMTLLTGGPGDKDKKGRGKVWRSVEENRTFAQYCGRMAEEFKGRGIIWEIWNEPNDWSNPTVDADYMAMAIEAIKAMRKADPECIIVAPSVSGFDIRFLEGCFKRGLLDYVSALCIHPYIALLQVPEMSFTRFLSVNNLVKQYSKGRTAVPIVSGEYGFSQLLRGKEKNRIRSQDEQAGLITRSVLISLIAGFPMHIIYTNLDYGGKIQQELSEPCEASYGVIAFDGKPKSGYHAIKTLTSQLNALRFIEMREGLAADAYDRLDGDYVAVFEGDDRIVTVAWTTAAPHQSRFEIPGVPTLIVDMKGKPMVIPETKTGYPDYTATARMVSIELTNQPIYISVKKTMVDAKK